MPDEFLTVAEIASTLKINHQTVRNWIDRGELPAVRVGARRVRVRQSQLDAFLAAGEITNQPQTTAETPVDADYWQLVGEAAAAVKTQDRDALKLAISALRRTSGCAE